MAGARTSIDDLIHAIIRRDMPAILSCLNSRIDLDQQNRSGSTPLTTASHVFNGEEIVELLVMRGASVDLKDATGHAPIHLAADIGNEKSLKILIQNKANLDSTTRFYGLTPLMFAANITNSLAPKKSYFECVKLLLEHRASASLTDRDKRTAFDHSISGHVSSRPPYPQHELNSSISDMLRAGYETRKRN